MTVLRILLITAYVHFALFGVCQVTFTDSNLPIVIIDTDNGVPIEDDPRVVGNMKIIDNGPGVRNYTTDPPTNYNGRIEIEIRGSTSQQYPKKNYGFETQDPLGNNLQVSILGMHLENDWILYGPYPDKTLIRNVLTFHLARLMGHYASDTRYCELVINGDYRGIYVMMERIKRDDGRVNIQNVHEANMWNDSLTGGYIMKVDKLTGEVGMSWASNYNPEVLFQFHDPEYDELSTIQQAYMINFIESFEDALWGPDFEDPNIGYPFYIDQQSFHDFTILQELGRTVDGYRSSSFFHKDKDALNWNSKIVAGPMWDFNLSYGNADYCDAFLTTGWQYDFDEVCDFSTSIPFWWERLLDSQQYRDGLRCRWNELRQGPLATSTIHNFIDSIALEIEEARIRNFQRWPIIGVYVNWNGFVGQTYQEDLDYLKSYIEQRANWIDQNLGGSCSLNISELSQEKVLHTCWPNPADNVLQLGFTLFQDAKIDIEVNDLTGNIVHRCDPEQFKSGMNYTELDVGHLSSGYYFYVIRVNDQNIYSGKFCKK